VVLEVPPAGVPVRTQRHEYGRAPVRTRADSGGPYLRAPRRPSGGRARRHGPVPSVRVCVVCGTPFFSASHGPRAKTCSPTCATIHRRVTFSRKAIRRHGKLTLNRPRRDRARQSSGSPQPGPRRTRRPGVPRPRASLPRHGVARRRSRRQWGRDRSGRNRGSARTRRGASGAGRGAAARPLWRSLCDRDGTAGAGVHARAERAGGQARRRAEGPRPPWAEPGTTGAGWCRPPPKVIVIQ
jgi:hypothetical protein